MNNKYKPCDIYSDDIDNGEMKKYYLESRSRGISYMKYVNRRLWIGHILRRNCLLKQVIEGKIKGG
jgi:hypothetical protein